MSEKVDLRVDERCRRTVVAREGDLVEVLVMGAKDRSDVADSASEAHDALIGVADEHERDQLRELHEEGELVTRDVLHFVDDAKDEAARNVASERVTVLLDSECESVGQDEAFLGS